MSGIEYSVTATFPSEALRGEFVSWLSRGHIQDVCRGGATRARITQPEEPSGSLIVVVRYDFPDRGAFDRYVREFAPALREEGLRLFGPSRGVSMARGLGTILFEFGGVPSASPAVPPQV